ncbi:PDT-domain-containing protein [Lentithecium fluviatile CBS 122367]|uniref:prephenate dehydratase n=1 Tax=Lentithecium fluviatile CBS 122367 TaxID=1168545 RepID=A0A6G1IQC4_9PLEO|nr:PDT-domain-containing protein [Lentithecium fluviatile CBS 122367]
MAQEKGKEKPIVAFLGPNASYTHQAALSSFDSASYTLHPSTTIEDIFSAVQNGEAYRGVVPFENSSNGSVVFTLDLFADLHGKYPDILVCAEAYIAVQHCLLGHQRRQASNPTSVAGNPIAFGHAGVYPHAHGLANVIESPLSSGAVTPTSKDPVPQKPASRPVGDLSRIRKIYSHPQAWGQCKVFLNTYLKGIERQDVSSTSRAAELVAQDPSGETAAVSSIIAAEIHGLKVLARGIEDRGDNTTRFFIIRRKPATSTATEDTSVSSMGETEQADAGDRKAWKSLISFTIDHANPGALAHSLAVLEKYGLNLTSINTRPSGVENWNYIFFVEIQARKLEGTQEGAVNRALGELDKVCSGWRWLGSWESRSGFVQ